MYVWITYILRINNYKKEVFSVHIWKVPLLSYVCNTMYESVCTIITWVQSYQFLRIGWYFFMGNGIGESFLWQ